MDEINIPKFDEFLSPILKYANDGKEHNLSETIDEMSREFNLNEKQENLLMSNGKRTYIYDRVAWAITYLVHAGLLLRTERSKFVISDTGRKEVKILPKKITYDYLKKFDSYIKFKEVKHSKKKNKMNNDEMMEIGLTPDEEIENIFENRNNMIIQDLLNSLYSIKPSDFERIIIDIVLALGYGKNFEEMARVIGQPGDQGIDGEISQDKLGFDKIYLQAKRWGSEQTVGGRDIRDFIGALTIKHAKKGIFITTTKFSKEAIDSVKKDSEHTIILIDGTELSKLMIDYNVGIRETKKYTLKEIDKDYFESFDN